VDTARIVQGQSILWKWSSGTHTVTNGTGSGDPQAGSLYDQPLSLATNTTFTFQFDNVGVFPFFCRQHEVDNMRGVVVVSAPVGVEPVPGPAHTAGFVGAPWPNPTQSGVTFRFALARAGHALAGVWDVRGRRVATPVDEDLPAGDFSGTWNGRTLRGDQAPPGVYLLRLEVPGASDVRRLVLDR
jgi:hypothetical protein